VRTYPKNHFKKTTNYKIKECDKVVPLCKPGVLLCNFAERDTFVFWKDAERDT
jgi:hypothetical protein